MFYVNVLCKYTIVDNIYYCILSNLTNLIRLIRLIRLIPYIATLSNTLVSPKYPSPKRALTNTSPLIL